MKTYAYILTVLAVAMVGTYTFASGADSSAYQGALFSGDSTKFADVVHSGGPRLFSVGVDFQGLKREMEYDNGFSGSALKVNHLAGILGFDATKWLTVYGGAGEADVNLGGNNHSANFEWLAGGKIRMLDYLVLEPWNDIDQYWVGLDFNSFFRNTTVDNGNLSSENLSEVFTSMTMSFYSRPEKPGAWDRVGFYVGPALSLLSFGNQSEHQSVGIIGGLQLNPSPNVSLKIEVQKFDDVGLGAGAAFHF